MHRRGPTVVAVPGHRGRQGSGGVDHDEVAGRKQGGQVKEAPMLDLAGPGHQQPHTVARHSPTLRWPDAAWLSVMVA